MSSYRDEKLTGSVSRTGLPQLDEFKIRLIEDLEWYDGPMSGLMTYEDQFYWFDLSGFCGRCEGFGCDCEDSGRHYYYVVRPLTDDQLQEAQARIKEDGEYSGPDLSEVSPIGWFMDGCNQNFYGIVVHKRDCDGRKNCDCIITKKK